MAHSIQNQFCGRVAGIALLFLLLTGSGYAQTAGSDLLPIPHPDLSGLDDAAREILADAQQRFERSAATDTGRNLGIAFGRLGMVYQNWQFHPATEAAFINAISLVPDDAHWPYYLALHYEETGQLDKAVHFYRQSLDLDPAYANTWLRLAEVLLELNNLTAALRGYEAALKLKPNMAAAFAGIGTIALRNQNYPRAIEHLSRALTIQPEASQLHYRLAQAYRKTGDVNKAREHLAKSGRRIASAPDPWVDIMKTRAHSAQHFIDLGITAMQERDFQTAAQNFNIAVTMAPDDAQAHSRLAAALTFMNQRQAALASIDKALSLDPDDVRALLMKGNILESLNRFVEALTSYRAAIALQPDDQATRFALANNLMRNARYKEATIQYGLLRAAQRENVTVRYWQALAYAAAGECGSALAPLTEAMSLQSGVLELTMANARIIATCRDADSDQLLMAERQAQQLLAYQRNGDHLETIAMVAAAKGEHGLAADYQADAIASGTVRGGDATRPFLQENQMRYKNNQRALLPWADGSPVYFPPLPRTR